MANNSSRDVELNIRARDYSQKTLKQVTDAISDMAKAQDAQRLAAERGEVTAKELEASYRKLESAGQALLKLNSLVEVYKRQTAALEAQQVKLEQTVEKQKELQAAYDGAEKVTKRQEAALARANRAVEKATQGLSDQQARVSRAAAELDKYGISTNELARSQQTIVANVGRVNAVLERQDNIIQRVPEAVRKYNQAWDEAIATNNRLDTARLEKYNRAWDEAIAINNRMDAAAKLTQQRLEEQAYAIDKVITGLRRQADEAIAASRGYQTLGRVVAATNLSTGGRLATDLQAIVTPAQAARSTLGGLEKQVDSLSREIEAGGKNIEGAAQKLKDLQAAQQAAIGMARLIDQFRAQTTAVRTARAEFQAARADVMQLAERMRAAQADTEGLGREMQAAQQRLNAATQALRTTGAAARQTQAALRSAGVDTRTLGTESDRLRTTAQRTTTAVDGLAGAVRRSGEAARDGAKAFSFFTDSGRTTLSATQRLKGEILALTTTYIGFQGAINLAGGAVDAFKTRQQALIKISQVVGKDQNRLNAEWEYMEGLANRLGVKIEDVAQGYTSFAVAAKATGLSLQQTKYVFESITKTGRVFHLSADDMQGVFRAMQQMLSKGQVYAEELTGQLGERLPAAVALFAKGMDMTTQELLKAMQNGEISSQAVINFARANAKAIDAEIETASKGVDAMEARAQNAMFNFKLAMADSGFIEAYVRMLERLTEFLNSPDGAEAAKKFGDAFSKAADAIIWCVDNIDILINALTVFAGLKAVQYVAGLVQGLRKLAPLFAQIGKIGDGILSFFSKFAARLATGTGAVKGLGIALGGLVRAIPYVGWALLAYDIGAIFYEQSQTFAKAVDEVIRDFKNLGNQLIALAETPVAALRDLAYAIVRPITTLFSTSITAIANWIADVVSLIPGVGEDLAKWTRDVAKELTKQNRDMFQNVSGIWDDVNDKWAKMNDDITKKYSQTMSEVVRQTLAAKAKMLQTDLSAAMGFQFTEDPGGGISKRDREVQALTKEFEKLQKSADKAKKSAKEALMRKNLPGRLALVDEEFAPQLARAKALGGDEGAKLTKQLQGIIAIRKQAETDEYNASQRSSSGIDKRARALENLTQKYKELKDSIQLKEVQQDPTSSLADRTAAAVQKANTEMDKYIRQANKLGGAEGKALSDQFTALKTVNEQYITQKMQLEEVERLENKVNNLLAIRKSRIEEINAKREAGVINEDQQVAGVNQVNQETQGPLNAALGQLQSAGSQAQSIMGPEAWAQLQANIAAAKASMLDLTGTFTTMDSTVVKGVLGGFEAAMDSIYDSMVQLIRGTQSLSDAFSNLGVAVAKFFADFLRQIAMAILQQMVLNALAGMGGGIGAAAQAAGGVAKGAAKHNGGIIGSSTTGGMQTRQMQTSWFANAPRFHTGGLPGLKSDEVPAILQKGEQVLSKDDPNNILNQQRSTSGGAASPQMNRFVLVDDRTKIPEAMNSQEGEQVFVQFLQRNAATVRQIASRKTSGRNG
ncbi:putative tape measure protein [Cronobacter phage JC01]|uniref:Putative tape measure protein n=1 Tax=Cronobacter phage JC01 TaxID=2729575 RepID=A0A6M3YL08_9CAUD|nr:tail length tape measure protein [Cronobacter phage JC01]QJI52242.1 putative tape measure protein [Cronobacter phage JC01]